jgi:hypothetical protein
MGSLNCKDCLHDGECVDLNYCGGAHFRSKFGKCSNCEATINIEEAEADEDGFLYCDACFEKMTEEEEDGRND